MFMLFFVFITFKKKFFFDATMNRSKMPLLWIHLPRGADMLVRFQSALEAYKFGIDYFSLYEEEEYVSFAWDAATYVKDNELSVGYSPSLQISVCPCDFYPRKTVAPLGAVEVAPEDALAGCKSDSPPPP